MLPIAVLSILGLATSVQATISCSSSSQCPESAPCCGQFGTCGTGANCLGGCNPKYSFKPEACMAMPICKDVETTFGSQSFPNVEEYMGNPNDTDWYYTGYVENSDDGLLIEMPKDSTGTVVSSSRFLWYGKFGATFKTSRGAGVVSAMISFSNTQDEIDWEFVNYNLEQAETNYFHQGVENWKNMEAFSLSNTFENFHKYEVEWTEDYVSWSLDGKVVRTLNKADTYNSATDEYDFPQTPSRVQLSLWPVLESAGEGTKEWAGGSVDWDSEDIQEKGYYYVTVKDAYIQCGDVPSGTEIDGSNAYVYTSNSEYNQDTVKITNADTVICSFDNSGLDDNSGCQGESEDASSSESSNSSVSSESSSSESSSHSSSQSSSQSSSHSSSQSSSHSSSQSSSHSSSQSSSHSSSQSSSHSSATSSSHSSSASSSHSSSVSASRTSDSSSKSSESSAYSSESSVESSASSRASSTRESSTSSSELTTLSSTSEEAITTTEATTTSEGNRFIQSSAVTSTTSIESYSTANQAPKLITTGGVNAFLLVALAQLL